MRRNRPGPYDPGADIAYESDLSARQTQQAEGPMSDAEAAEVREVLEAQPTQELRKQAILRLIRSGHLRADDPVLNEIARDYGVLRRRERTAAVAGALGRTITGGLGPLIGTDTSEAARKIPLTPREREDQIAEDRQTALRAYEATAPTAAKFFEVDEKNIKAVQESVTKLMDGIIKRANDIETSKYNAMAKASELRKDFGIEQMRIMQVFNEMRKGEMESPRGGEELIGEVQAYILDQARLPPDMQSNTGLALIVSKATKNEEEVRNLVQELAQIGRDPADPMYTQLLNFSSDWTEMTDSATMEQDLISEDPAYPWSVANVALRGKEAANQLSALSYDQLGQMLVSGKTRMPEYLLDDIPGETEAEKNIAMANVLNKWEEYQAEYMNVWNNPKVLQRFTNNLMREAVKVGYTPEALTTISKDIAMAMGYESVDDFRAKLESFAISTGVRESAATGTQERLGTFAEKMFERPRAQRTQEFKIELLRPENAAKLAKLDAYARQVGLSRDDALSALTTQMARDASRRRVAAPSVLEELARNKSVAAIRAKKALKPAGEKITRKSAPAAPTVPMGDLGPGAVTKKPETDLDPKKKDKPFSLSTRGRNWDIGR